MPPKKRQKPSLAKSEKDVKPKKKAAANARAHRKKSSKVEEQLKIALNAANMGIWEWNTQTNSVQWSDNVYKIFGFKNTNRKITYELYLSLVHPGDRQDLIRKINEALHSGKDYFVQHRILWPDDSIHWVESRGKIILNKNRKLLSITGTVADITEKKILEREREDWKTRYELIVSSYGQVIYDYDIGSGNIIWSGDTRVLRYAPQEMGNLDQWVAKIHPEDREKALRELKIAQTSLQKYDIHYRFRHREKQYRIIHDRGLFLADALGQAYRMLGVMEDVTGKVTTAEALKEKSRFIESIAKAAPDFIHVLDIRSTKPVYYNRSLLTYLGYSEEESRPIRENFLLLMHPDDQKTLNSLYHTLKNEPNGMTFSNEYRMLHKDGSWRWMYSIYTIFKRDEDGNPIEIIGTSKDITEQKNALRALKESEERFRNLVENLTAGIILYNARKEVSLVNKLALELLGIEPDQLQYENWKNINWHAIYEDGSHFPDKMSPSSVAIDTKKSVRGVIMGIVRPRDLQRIWLLVNAEPMLNADDSIQSVVVTLNDITDRKNVEELLRESEFRFRTLHEASFGGIGLHDEGTIIDCNQGLSALTGYRYDELKGMDGLLLIAPEYRSTVMERIQAKYDKPYDAVGLRKDGSSYHMEIRGKNVPYKGKMIRVTEFRDITERKQFEEKIVEQNIKLQTISEDLKRKNEQLEEFTQIVSHNLRSPVGNILSLLNYYELSNTEEEKEEYIRYLKESGQNTLLTLNELNEVLKIKQNANIEKQQLSFEKVLQNVIAMLSIKIAETSAVITTDFAVPTVEYPNIYLESIFLNLISNSLKYCHPQRKPVISIYSYEENGCTTMKVTDNGLGIDLSKYGHQLFRMRKTFHLHPESRGIGLFLTKSQIDAMGGEIKAYGKENEGITFVITFDKPVK